MGFLDEPRPTTQPQAISAEEILAIRHDLHRRARQWAAEAPDAYPDGSPLPAEDLLCGLADAATRVMAIGLPDPLWEQLAVAGTVLRDLASQAPDLEVVGAMVDVRKQLIAAGLPDAADAVHATTATIGRYYAQAGAEDPFLDALDPDH